MRTRGRNPTRRLSSRWGSCLGLLALLLQLAAVAVPMPAMAGAEGAPAWLNGSLCRSDGSPVVPDHPVCPVCFVLSQAAGAMPPAAVAITPPVAATPAPVRDSEIPASEPSWSLPARGPPAAA